MRFRRAIRRPPAVVRLSTFWAGRRVSGARPVARGSQSLNRLGVHGCVRYRKDEFEELPDEFRERAVRLVHEWWRERGHGDGAVTAGRGWGFTSVSAAHARANRAWLFGRIYPVAVAQIAHAAIAHARWDIPAAAAGPSWAVVVNSGVFRSG